MSRKETNAKSYLTHLGAKVIYKKWKENQERLFICYYRQPNINNYLPNKSDLNPIQ